MTLPRGFPLGEGGIARPSLGVRAPLDRAPGIAGRSRGTGEDIMGTELGSCAKGEGASGVGAFISSTEVSLGFVTVLCIVIKRRAQGGSPAEIWAMHWIEVQRGWCFVVGNDSDAREDPCVAGTKSEGQDLRCKAKRGFLCPSLLGWREKAIKESAARKKEAGQGGG